MNPNEQPPAADPSPSAASPEASSEETIRKIYARDLREKDRIHTVFKVTRKGRVTARSGKSFLTVGLGDKSGEVDARVFDRVDEADAAFVAQDYLLVEGNVIAFHGKTQLVIEKLQRLDPEPIDAAEFAVPPPPPQEKPAERAAAASPATERREAAPARTGSDEAPGREAVQQMRELVERVQDEHVKALLLSFLDDPEIAKGLPYAPAAKGIHHAYRGGLAEHILSVMRLAHRMADHYPMADRDLLVAGALLHDIDKVREISAEKNFEYTDQGRLVGHIVMTAQKIHEKAAAIPGFPKLLEHHLTHIVLAHHGQLEYGSPKLPMTLEAHIVHAIDSLDSRIASWLELMTKDSKDAQGNWTETSKLYERHLWKGPAPTSRGRSPVEGRGRRAGGAGPSERSERRKRKDRPSPAVSRVGRAAEKEPGLPVTFKPLESLTGPAAPKEPETDVKE